MSSQILHRIKQLSGELGYAQSRLFELRTGVPVTAAGAARARRREIAGLEAALTLGQPRR
jgi:hypothetical protein